MTGCPQTFSKKERLCGQRKTSALLSKGRYGNESMLRYCFRASEECSRLMVSVPKRLFRRAVRRNLLKRRIRESFRRQKFILDGTPADLLIIWNSKETGSYAQVYAAVGAILEKIAHQLDK
ncbi:MAG: ribonuclease P protein component [Candidatus Cryptobacteroides sp.]